MTKTKRIILSVISFIGLITSFELVNIFYTVNSSETYQKSFCAINSFIDCDTVAKTSHAYFLGIPLALWGVILYLIILTLLFADKLKIFKLFKFLEVFKNQLSYIAAIGIFSFIISMSLACISIFDIHAICILCVFTYFLNLLIGIIAAWNYKKLDDILKDCFKDFIAAISQKVYLIAFVIVVVIGSLTLIYTNTTNILLPHAEQIAKNKYFQSIAELKKNPYAVSGNILGDPRGRVILTEYTDFECPHCSLMNIIIQKVVKGLKNVKVIHKNFPLDSSCNKYVQVKMHPNACMFARYTIAAREQGKYWDMGNLIFDNKPKTEDELISLATAEIKDLDIQRLKQDAKSSETEDKLQRDIQEGFLNKLQGTPAIMVGFRFLPPGITEYELEYELIQAGAIKR